MKVGYSLTMSGLLEVMLVVLREHNLELLKEVA